jgi:hypothetical protein
MIDKADFQVPAGTQHTRLMQSIVRDLDRDKPRGADRGWRPNKIYKRSASLEPYGIPAIIYEDQMGPAPHHKIELLEVGEKPLSEMRETIWSVYDCEPWELRPMRLDLTADVRDVPVSWCKKNIKVMRKQNHHEWGSTPYETISQGIAQTMTGGKKPGQFRNYDKTGHRISLWKSECLRVDHLNRKIFSQARYKDLLEMAALGMYDPEKMARWTQALITTPSAKGLQLPRIVARPIFEDMFPGHNMKEKITRFEMQFGRRASLESIEQMRMHDLFKVDRVEPFSILKFLDGNGFERWPQGFTLEQYCTLVYLRTETKLLGTQAAWNFFREHKNRQNAYRDWKKYLPHLATETRLCTSAQLQEEYVLSTRRQQYAA